LRLEVVAVEQVERVERDHALAVGMRDVHARLAHAAQVEVVAIEELHDHDAEHVLVAQRCLRRRA
jgi:hypothetical protein